MSLFLVDDDSDLIDNTPPIRPSWLPAREPDADWTFPQTIPSLPDPALREPEEARDAD